MEMQMDVGLNSWYIRRCKKKRSNNSISCHEKHLCFFFRLDQQSQSQPERPSQKDMFASSPEETPRWQKWLKWQKWMIGKQKGKIPSFFIVQVWIFSFLTSTVFKAWCVSGWMGRCLLNKSSHLLLHQHLLHHRHLHQRQRVHSHLNQKEGHQLGSSQGDGQRVCCREKQTFFGA